MQAAHPDVDGLELLAQIGAGASAIVWAARTPDGSPVAVKIARDALSGLQRTWFHREAALTARLVHPGIVRLRGSGHAQDGRPYLIYDRVDGVTVESVADRLGLDAILDIGGQLFDALAYAHDAGVIHCDITPGNVLLVAVGGGWSVRLTDFGLAQARDSGHDARTVPSIVSGTPGFMSPEQARGLGAIGPRSDLYGAGALLFRLLTGYAPHGGPSPRETVQRTLHADPLPLYPRGGLEIPEALGAVVHRLLARLPHERYASATAAARAWRAAGRTARRRPERRAASAAGGDPQQTLIGHDVATLLPLEDAGTYLATRSGKRAARKRASEHAELAGPPLVGRDRCVEALEGALRERPVVAVTGPPSSGRSRLLGEVARRAEREGAVVAVTTARRVPPGVRLEVATALALDLCGAARMHPPWLAAEHLATALERAGVPVSDPGRDALIGVVMGVPAMPSFGLAAPDAHRALRALLEASGRRALLVVDDADGADPDSMRLLDALARSDLDVSVLVAGQRAPERAVEIALEPLSEEARALLWSALTLRPAAELPGWPGELLDVAGAAALDPAEAATLAAAALFEGDAPLRALGAVAEALEGAPVDVDATAPRLIARGHLRAVSRPAARAEAWVRAARVGPQDALSTIPEAARRRGHAAAAQWLARHCVDAGRVVHHRIAEHAERAGEPEMAAWAWAEAGRLAADDRDLVGARESLRRALAVEGGAPAVDVAGVAGRLCLLDAEVGDAAATHRHATLALEHLDPDRTVLRARVLRADAQAYVDAREIDLALERIDAALGALERSVDPIELASALALKGWVLGYLQGRNEEGIALGREALAVASRIDAPAFRASLCGKLGANYLRAGDWDGQLRTNEQDLALSTRAHDPSGVIRAHVNLGVCHTNRGDLLRALEHTRRAAELSAEHGSAGARLVCENNLAMIRLDLGETDAAREHAERAIRQAELSGQRRSSGETWCTLARLHLRTGDLEACDSALARVAEMSSNRIHDDAAVRVAALLDAARGDAAAAVERTEPLVDPDREHDPYDLACSRVTRAALLERAGRRSEAARCARLADEALIRLGADPALERARWGAAALPPGRPTG